MRSRHAGMDEKIEAYWSLGDHAHALGGRIGWSSSNLLSYSKYAAQLVTWYALSDILTKSSSPTRPPQNAIIMLSHICYSPFFSCFLAFAPLVFFSGSAFFTPWAFLTIDALATASLRRSCLYSCFVVLSTTCL